MDPKPGTPESKAQTCSGCSKASKPPVKKTATPHVLASKASTASRMRSSDEAMGLLSDEETELQMEQVNEFFGDMSTWD